ncbi:MAG: PD40 domain-containing protein [Armatimonadetes bacterium]|nr:PD40 domain-containing protein [Armatimonadota bacterium]MDE2207941.1 PD40 domain-containing protein [Armatimonadota bacterium]
MIANFRARLGASTHLVGALAVILAASRSVSAQTPFAGDLLTPAQPSKVIGAGWPALSPHGHRLVFTYLGDLWEASVSGGRAHRLTVNEALDASAHWSPDGKWIAFTSLRTGNADVFIIPAQGGEPRQVTFNSANDWVNDWSRDGNSLLFYSIRDTHTWALWQINLHTMALKQLTHDEEPLRFGQYSPDGTQIAYTRSGQPWFRPWYKGSVAAQTLVQNVANGQARTVMPNSYQEFWPLWSAHGRALYITTIAGGSHTPNLWRVGVEGGKPTPITHYTSDAVRWPTISGDGSLLAYLYAGEIYTCRPDGSDAHKVVLTAPTDDTVNNQSPMKLSAGVDESEPSPDGKQLAVVLKADIWLMKAGGGQARNLTSNPATDNDINWSPDGKQIVFISDRGNQPDIYLMDVATGKLTRLTDDTDTESGPAFSPDGKWISFAKSGKQDGLYVIPAAGGPERQLARGNGNNEFGTGISSQNWSADSQWIAYSRADRYDTTDVWVVPAVGGTPINVTQYPGFNFDPQFSRDGRSLFFVASRGGPPTLYELPLQAPGTHATAGAPPGHAVPVRIDFTDIKDRAHPFAPMLAPVDEFAVSPDGQKLIVHAHNAFWAVPLNGGPPTNLTPGGMGGSNIRVAADGSHFFFIGDGGSPKVMGAGGGPVTTIPFDAEYIFDRRLQYRQAFNEFYRRFGQAFYDPGMNGLNWAAARARYEPQIAGVATPMEFANLLSELVGEVNSSHSEIGPAGGASGPQTASLGMRFDQTWRGPGLKVTSIVPNGPADKPETGIKVGDYVMQINGVGVSFNEKYFLTLQDEAGKPVKLLVNNTPDIKDGRTVTVKPVSAADIGNLEYQARVKRNRAIVDKASGGRLAYMHIRGMDPPSLQQFDRDLWSYAVRKDGLVLDIRENGGGNTHDALLSALSRRVYAYNRMRDGELETQPTRAWTKPIVLLIDQNSYSDAEIFPAGFRALKLGKIVGVTTPGYVIGTYEGTLVDGTHFRMPTVGWFTKNGRNMENLGIRPDVPVENTLQDIHRRYDAQLNTAIAVCLKEVADAAAKRAKSHPPVMEP